MWMSRAWGDAWRRRRRIVRRLLRPAVLARARRCNNTHCAPAERFAQLLCYCVLNRPGREIPRSVAAAAAAATLPLSCAVRRCLPRPIPPLYAPTPLTRTAVVSATRRTIDGATARKTIDGSGVSTLVNDPGTRPAVVTTGRFSVSVIVAPRRHHRHIHTASDVIGE